MPQHQSSGTPARDQVFISYSRKDNQFLQELQTHLKPYMWTGAITAWTDQQIAPGSKWFDEIKAALAKTSAAVLLVSPDFLASDFIHEHELDLFLREAKAGGVKILWVLIRDCSYEETPLKDYQAAVYALDKAFALMTEAERATAWKKVCQQIKKAVAEQAAKNLIGSPDAAGTAPVSQGETVPADLKLGAPSASTAALRLAIAWTGKAKAIGCSVWVALALIAVVTPAYVAWSRRTEPPAPSPVEIRAHVDLSPGTVPPAPSSAAVLSGYVTDAETRVPLADVNLTIQDWDTRNGGSAMTTTNAAGRFRFENLRASDDPTRQVRLIATKPGYDTSTTDPPLGATDHPIKLKPLIPPENRP
ncbi:MAG: TIR domain-containing protein [Isosphaeraceae bacterium]